MEKLTRIIAAFAGVVKTHFCEVYQHALDLVVVPFKYENYSKIADSIAEGESIKAHAALELRRDWRKLYYKALIYTYRRYPGEVLVIPTDSIILYRLEQDKIPYTIVYPDRSLKEEYRARYLARGNTASFLDVFIGNWDMWMDWVRDNNGTYIELQSGEFLSDVIHLPDRVSGIIENKENFITQLIHEIRSDVNCNNGNSLYCI